MTVLMEDFSENFTPTLQKFSEVEARKCCYTGQRSGSSPKISAKLGFTVTLSKESGSATPGAPASATVTVFDNESVIFADGFEGEP